MDVSIIIVNYNTKQLISNCINSIYKYTKDIEFEIIVSDNGSKDGSIEMIKATFPNVILIENNENLGFGAANNRGLKIAQGKYVFYLNSDTVLYNNAIKIFFDYWENASNKDQIGALGGILLDENMNETHSYGDFPSYFVLCKQQINNIIFHGIKTIVTVLQLRKLYENKQTNFSNESKLRFGEIQGYITGADLFLLNDNNAYFDENYFMYLEETDLQLRLKKIGRKMIILDTPKIQHLYRKIGGKNFIVKFADVCLQQSSLYYCKKNLEKKGLLLRLLILLDSINPVVRKLKKQIPFFN